MRTGKRRVSNDHRVIRVFLAACPGRCVRGFLIPYWRLHILEGQMNRSTIEQRIQSAIRPQLDRCDELLDYYLADAPPEVWEPIAFKVAADHYGKIGRASCRERGKWRVR